MAPKKQRNILIGIVLLLLGGLGYGYHQYNKTKTELEISEQNKKALNDSIRVYKDSTEYAKQVLVSKNNEIKELNEELSKEVENTEGDVHEVTKVVTKIKHDTIRDTIETKNGDSLRKFDIYRDFGNGNSLAIKGHTSVTNVLISEHEIGINTTSGLRTRNDSLEFFVRSEHPGFSVKEIHSSLIDPNSHPVIQKFADKCQDPWQIGFGMSVEGNRSYFDFAPRVSLEKSNINAGYEYNILNNTHEISLEKKVDLW